MLRKTVRRLGLAGLAVSVMVGGAMVPGATHAAGPACATPAEAEALRVRTLQNRLMVSALACNQAAAYDAFILRFDDQLAEHGRVMSDYFARRHGANRARRLVGDYLTAQANLHSLDSMADRGAFCRDSLSTFAALMEADETALRERSAQMPAARVEGPLACLQVTSAQEQAPGG